MASRIKNTARAARMGWRAEKASSLGKRSNKAGVKLIKSAEKVDFRRARSVKAGVTIGANGRRTAKAGAVVGGAAVVNKAQVPKKKKKGGRK